MSWQQLALLLSARWTLLAVSLDSGGRGSCSLATAPHRSIGHSPHRTLVVAISKIVLFVGCGYVLYSQALKLELGPRLPLRPVLRVTPMVNDCPLLPRVCAHEPTHGQH